MANTATNLDQQGGAPEEARGSARFFSRRRAVKSPSEALQPEAAPPPPSGPPPSKRNPMLSAISGFLSFLLVAFAACGGLFFFAQKQVTAPGPLAADKVVYIASNVVTDLTGSFDYLASGIEQAASGIQVVAAISDFRKKHADEAAAQVSAEPAKAGAESV